MQVSPLSQATAVCAARTTLPIKKTEQRIAELQDQGIDVELIVIGNKGATYFNRRETPVCKTLPTQVPPTQEEVRTSSWRRSTGRARSYRAPLHLLHCMTPPSHCALVPFCRRAWRWRVTRFKLTPEDGDLAVEKEKVAVAEPKEFSPDMIFEQEPSQLLNAILPLYLNGQLLRTLQESVASELASRMSAMQSATDNAKDLQGRLEREMNRARQAKITQELMEIIAGADATG